MQSPQWHLQPPGKIPILKPSSDSTILSSLDYRAHHGLSIIILEYKTWIISLAIHISTLNAIMARTLRIYILIFLLPCLINCYQKKQNKVNGLFQKFNATQDSGLFSHSIYDINMKDGLDENNIVKNGETKNNSCLCLEETCGKILKNCVQKNFLNYM